MEMRLIDKAGGIKRLAAFFLFTFMGMFHPKAQPVSFPLYTGAMPGQLVSSIAENTILVNGTRRIYHVIEPTLTLFQPAVPNGIAVIICPGGAYSRLSIDNEGELVAIELIKKGITAIVLKYRLPNDTTMEDKSIGPLQDLQYAIRCVRKHAAQWNLQSNKIGIMGFSAGGHLAAMATVHADFNAGNDADTTSARPDFAALIYPVISCSPALTHQQSKINLLGAAPTPEQERFFSAELQVTSRCSPVFLVHAKDDGAVPFENSVAFYDACVAKAVPGVIYLYPAGGHGFGLNNFTTPDRWLERFVGWVTGL